jgi:hypothetical protein
VFCLLCLTYITCLVGSGASLGVKLYSAVYTWLPVMQLKLLWLGLASTTVLLVGTLLVPSQHYILYGMSVVRLSLRQKHSRPACKCLMCLLPVLESCEGRLVRGVCACCSRCFTVLSSSSIRGCPMPPVHATERPLCAMLLQHTCVAFSRSHLFAASRHPG